MNLEKALKILDVRAPLGETELKRAYLILVKSCHPDRFHHNEILKKEGEENLKSINLAYEYINAHSSEFQAYNTRKRQEKPADSEPEDIKKDVKSGGGDKYYAEKQDSKSGVELKKRSFFSKIHESVNIFFNNRGDAPEEKPRYVHEKRTKRKSFREILREKDGYGYDKKRRKFNRSYKAKVNWFMLNRKQKTYTPGDKVEKIEPVSPVKGFTRKK